MTVGRCARPAVRSAAGGRQSVTGIGLTVARRDRQVLAGDEPACLEATGRLG